MLRSVRILCSLFVLLFALETRCDVLTAQSEVLRKLFSDMDIISMVRPPAQKNPNIKFFEVAANVSGDPVIVTVDMHILDVTDIDDDNQEFKMTLYLRQSWNDPRLRYSSSESKLEFVTISDPSRVWVPDLFVINEKQARIGDVTTKNAMVRIKKNGDVFYSTRLSVTLSCEMDHTKFPLDKQRCSINLESYGYQMKDIVLIWTEGSPLTFSKKLTTKPFDVKAYGYDYCNSKLSSGEYCCVRAELLLERRGATRYVLQAYIPLVALVIFSYAPLWCSGQRSQRLAASGVAFLLVAGVAAAVTSLAPHSGDYTALECLALWSVFLSALPLFAMTLSAMLECCCRPPQRTHSIPITVTANNKISDEGNKTAVALKLDAAQKLNSDAEATSVTTVDDSSWFQCMSCIPGSRLEQMAALILPLIFLLITFAYIFQNLDLKGIRALSTVKKVPY